jgi:hypothetical protein
MNCGHQTLYVSPEIVECQLNTSGPSNFGILVGSIAWEAVGVRFGAWGEEAAEVGAFSRAVHRGG